MTDPIVHDGWHPARSWRNRPSSSMPFGVWPTSGWYCTPQIRRSSFSRMAIGAFGVEPQPMKPSGATVMPSKWLIHTVWLGGASGPSREPDPPGWVVRVVRPYSP